MTGRFSRVFVGSNHKMYKTNQQTVEYLRALQDLSADISRSDLSLFVLPPYVALADACRAVDPTMITIGAQNMHWEDQGEFTGEISARMLAAVGVSLVMVGHAERRRVFGETDEMVNRRALASLRHGFQTLICVGETAGNKRFGISKEQLSSQLKIALHRVEQHHWEKIWIAYEPDWAIGENGELADPRYVDQMHAWIHETLAQVSPKFGETVPVLYGGSVNLSNALDFISQPEVDGLFIGRAAWDAASFNAILRRIICEDGRHRRSSRAKDDSG